MALGAKTNFEGVPYLEVSKYPISCPFLIQITQENGVNFYYTDLQFSILFGQRRSCNSIVNEEK